MDHFTEASVGINSRILLKDDKHAFLHPLSSHNGWLIEINAVQLVWRTVLHTSNLNQDPLQNTWGYL
jgi:hypothetical protein